MICKFARKGMTPSQIGILLRDQHGIPLVGSVTGSKVLRILKGAGLAPELPEDLYFMIKKAGERRGEEHGTGLVAGGGLGQEGRCPHGQDSRQPFRADTCEDISLYGVACRRRELEEGLDGARAHAVAGGWHAG